MNKTTFAGLELKNPIIISSCGRTAKAENNKAFEEAGAAAVVLKSLFEENITRETEHLSHSTDHAEAADYMQSYIRSHALADYIQLIKDSKKLCTIPVIASINCHSKGEWIDFAKSIQEAGADALELNIMGVPDFKSYKVGDYEQLHLDIVSQVRKVVNIPLIVKLGSNITNPVALIEQLKIYGANAVVLFNRSYQPDINIDTMEFKAGSLLSDSSDLSNSLRWTGIASALVDGMDYAISGGVHSGEDVVKAILSGAAVVEVTSAIYKNGNGWIQQALEVLTEWQKKQHYQNICEFKGKMNAAAIDNPDFWLRTQFLKYFASNED